MRGAGTEVMLGSPEVYAGRGANARFTTGLNERGRVYKLNLTGKILSTFGHMGRTPGTVDWVRAVACPNERTIYVAEERGSTSLWLNRRRTRPAG
jgi:hypothetical protein